MQPPVFFSRWSAALCGLALLSLTLDASAHDNRHHDGYTGASKHRDAGELSRDTRQALHRFDEQKHRDYRRLGRRHFDSERERERAYRELRKRHRKQLREILGEKRFHEQRYRDYHDDRDYDDDRDYRDNWDDHEGRHHRRQDRVATRAFDPAIVLASLAAQWALSEDDHEDLADALEDFQQDLQEYHEERFDNPREQREARRELQEDYREELRDILDDSQYADLNAILQPFLQY